MNQRLTFPQGIIIKYSLKLHSNFAIKFARDVWFYKQVIMAEYVDNNMNQNVFEVGVWNKLFMLLLMMQYVQHVLFFTYM